MEDIISPDPLGLSKTSSADIEQWPVHFRHAPSG